MHDFLALVEAISGRASDLVHALVSIEAVSELGPVHARRAAAKRLAFDEPWSAAVLRVLETSEYRAHESHPPGYIAARLGLDTADEARILTRLQAAGVERLEHARYEAGAPLTVDTQASPADVRRLRAHWTQGTARVSDWASALGAAKTAAESHNDARENNVASFVRECMPRLVSHARSEPRRRDGKLSVNNRCRGGADTQQPNLRHRAVTCAL